MGNGNQIDEYKIVSDNIRWYSNMRFAQLTLFVATTAAIANLVFSEKLSRFPLFSNALMLGGVISSVVFWFLEMRADDYWSHFMKRAVELEKGLGFRQYTDRPIMTTRTTNLVRMFIGAIGLFWFLVLFASLFI